MSDKKNPLAPCPFCRGSVLEIGPADQSRDIYCKSCGMTAFWPASNKPAAIAAWNRRAPSPRMEAESRLLKAARNLYPSEGALADEPRIDYDEVQIDKDALKEFRDAVAALDKLEAA